MNGRTALNERTSAVWYTWGQYAAVAGVYVAVYEIAYYLSFQQFLLTTGLRLACMLLLPSRFWPALAIGEAVPLVETAVFCAEKWGTLWAILASVPTVALWWPMLKPLRDRWALYDESGRLRMPVIIGATFGAALITATFSTLMLSAALAHAPGKWPSVSPVEFFFAYLLGAYMGALTLTPSILALRERFHGLKRPFQLAVIWRSRLLRDVLSWVVPALAVLACVAVVTDNENVRQIARLALLWPVVGLTSRHGWHGTAVGGMAASFALALTTSGQLDRAALTMQAVLVFVLSVTLLMKARMPSAERGIRVQRL